MDWNRFAGLFLVLVSATLYFFTDGLVVVGMLLGALCYHQFGIQPRFIGWPLVLVALVLVWRTGLWSQNLVLLSAINLAIMALLSFYYQMKDEDATPPLSDTQALHIRDVFSLSGGRFAEPLTVWAIVSRTFYSVWGTWAILLSPWSYGDKVEIPYYVMATIAAILITVRFSGGTRGKVWEIISAALQVKGGIVPRPSINQ